MSRRVLRALIELFGGNTIKETQKTAVTEGFLRSSFDPILFLALVVVRLEVPSAKVSMHAV